MKWIDLLFHVEDDRSNGRFFLYEIYGREILILVSQPLRKFYVDSLLHISHRYPRPKFHYEYSFFINRNFTVYI